MAFYDCLSSIGQSRSVSISASAELSHPAIAPFRETAINHLLSLLEYNFLNDVDFRISRSSF
jgi:hypothetical protein